MRRLVALSIVVALLVGCGDDGAGTNDQNNNDTCASGLERQGPACVPVFNDCPDPGETPVPGGGCQPVGVTQCATGFAEDGEAGCEPVLPAQPCPAGTMEVLGATECQPVGVVQCATGFVPDGEGACDPILPSAPCLDNTLEVLGQTACQPIGDCGPDPWGNVVTDATTIYVDASYSQGNSDGTAGAPFLTIEEALALVQPAGQIVVAAGEYNERLVIDRPVHLAGRCAGQVTVRGTQLAGYDLPPVHIHPGGSGTRLGGLTLTGDATGLAIDGAQNVRVEAVQIRGNGSIGVDLTAGAEVGLTRVAVASCTSRGIRSVGSTLTLFESVVRETLEDAGGRYGRGISVACDTDTAVCGRLRVDRSVVAANTQYGIGTLGVETEVIASVVKGTLPGSDGRFGRGIHAQCVSSGACGGLTVTDSVVSNNSDIGIAILGVPTEIASTVVRDTEAQQLTQTFGHGIAVQCYPPTAACAQTRVTGSAVVGNRELGIATVGVDVSVTSTVVRDTAARPSDLRFGLGIESACDAQLGTCGRLTLARCMIEGNREVGVNILGPEASVVDSVVRGTLGRHGDGILGRGISAQCASTGTCGPLTVTSSVIAENREAGVFAAGVELAVNGSLVHGTQPQQSDGTLGKGIAVQCFPDTGTCGTATVNGTVVSANREMGIFLSGVHGTVTSTVVRDTASQQSDGLFGRGINAQCDPDAGACGTLTVEHSLVRSNQDVGICISGMEASLISTVVRDTAPRSANLTSGRGIESHCHASMGVCGPLAVSGCRVTGNSDLGIATFGVEAAIASTVVENTQAQPGDWKAGRGINAQCSLEAGTCGSLTLTGCWVRSNLNTGIFIAGVPAVLWGSAVEDTRPNDQGDWRDDFGQGIFALCDEITADCASLQMTSCLVASAFTAGLAVENVSGFIESSRVSTVPPRPLDDAYGYGIQAAGQQDAPTPVFDVRSCLIQDGHLAGILYSRAGGTVSGSQIDGGLYSIVAAVGSSPQLTDDNTLSGSERDGLVWTSMDTCPAPPPVVPTGL